MTARRSLRPNMLITGFSAISFLLCQIISDCLDNQFMIFFLRQTRNSGRADNASVFQNNGEAPAMGTIFVFRYQVGLLDTLALALQQLSDVEGTMPKPIHKADFSLYPFI